jgi:hypothetical protein
MARDIVWEWLDRPGLEHLSLEIRPGAVSARGLMLVQLGPAPVRVAYEVELDGAWTFQRARLTVDQDRALDIVHGPDDVWTVDGKARPDLAGCIDIDIMATPFTNSLPIRRLAFEPDRPLTIQAAYIRLPDLTVEPAAQDYTKLDAARFRYRSLSTGFTADLTVDADGLVVEYPPFWRRRSDGAVSLDW